MGYLKTRKDDGRIRISSWGAPKVEIIKTNQLSKSFGDIRALSDLTMKIKPGQSHVLS